MVAAHTYVVSLSQTIDTSLFSPPSPDPAGIAYLDSSNTLMVSDSEVNEMSIYAGANLFEMTLDGGLVDTTNTTSFSNEPTGVAYNAVNGHLFFCDDDAKDVSEMDPGADGLYGTTDDIITEFDTGPFGSNDPEGVTFDSASAALFIADGVGAEVYRITPGDNGFFDGISPAGDDQVTHFDTDGLGVYSLQGIALNSDNGLLYFVGLPPNIVVVTTVDGTLMHKLDISAASPTRPAGLTIGPSSSDPAETSLYITDRGIDNDDDPNENDGKVYEMTLPPADATPPDTRIDSTPPDPDNDATPTFSFTGSDPGGSGVAGFECRVDRGDWSSCASPHTTAMLGNGDHTFEVRAVDKFGNRDPSPASYTWAIDAPPPVYLPFVRR
jgi:hypothetical protein